MATPTNRRTRQGTKNGSRSKPRSGSRILSRLGKWSTRAFWAFENGLGARLFCGGEHTEKALGETLAARGIEAAGLRENVLTPYKRAIAEGTLSSRILRFGDWFRDALFLTKTRFFAVVGLFFSLYTVAGFFLYQYFSFSYSKTSVSDLIMSAVILLGSLLLLFSGKTLSETLSGSRLFCRLFVGVLGIDPDSLRSREGTPSAHGTLAFILGTALGIAGVLLYPHRVVLWTLQLALALMVLAVPESGLLLSVLMIPFVPLRVTAPVVIATFVSYFLKLLRLKRTFRLRVPELMMFLTVLSVFLASVGGNQNLLEGQFPTWLLFGLVWVLTVNLIKTGTLYRKYVACLMYGGMITLALKGTGFLLEAFGLEQWLAYFPGTALDSGVLGIYLVTIVPVTLLHGKRWSGLLTMLLVVLNAYFLQSMWVWLGILVSVLLFFLFAKRAFFESLIAGGITVPMFVAVFGDRLTDFARQMSPSAGALLQKYWTCGIGAGEQILRIGAAANGLVPDGFSMHMYGRLLLEGGVPQLLLFLLAALFALQYVFTAMRDSQSKNAKIICGGMAAALLMFLICGFAADLQTDPRLLGLLWCICPAASMSKDLYGRRIV